MTNAPALSSIISPEYLSNLVINRYNLPQETTCSILKIGINHSYLVSTPTNKFVLRVYYLNWKTEVEINEELRLLNYLKNNNILVSYAILDSKNTYVQKINASEGERFAVLFSFAEGEAIRVPTQELCFKLGESMAKMHLLTTDKTLNRKNYHAETLVNWAYQAAKNHFKESTKEITYFERAAAIITSEFKKAKTSNLRHGIVHLDLWYENMRIKNETEITYFDFDNCGNGWLFLDLSYSLMVLFRNEPKKEDFILKRDSFYKGYGSITPISEEEKRLIPYGGLAIWLHYNGIHVDRFNDFSNQFLSEEFFKYWIHTVNQWMTFNKITI
ncbi:phosphotransferase [Xanthomarina sp.]|uniref:phosphotransferase n=1 Tax=Xanthomarina sp. TaxID=1931211 RepID=UPI002CC09AAF|nr:phosphotransferase [Xanthomarina sp.]HLV39381.1 phosphotransferase [Xanthomarina sp.]